MTQAQLDFLRSTVAPMVYLASVILFILGLGATGKVRTAGRGRPMIGVGLGLAVVGALAETGARTTAVGGFILCIVLGGTLGAIFASRMPAAAPAVRASWVSGCVGAAAALVSASVLDSDVEMVTSRTLAIVGAAVFGSVSFLISLGVTFRPTQKPATMALATLAATLAGAATALLGLGLENVILLVAGGVACTAGLALGRAVGATSGRSLSSLLLGGVPPAGTQQSGYTDVRSCGTEEAAMVLESASNVVIVPGLGMAISHAQHAVKELVELLDKRGVKVTYAIHPAAGCVPGHMNTLLDEANVPHDRLVEIEDAAALIHDADAVVVVGANDIVNPAGASDPKSAVFGMQGPDLKAAPSVFVIKRSLGAGTTGAKNPLFEQHNTMMIFGDAKRVVQALITDIKGAAH